MSKEYKIPCSWEMYGYMYVEASSLEDAISKADRDEPLPDGDYMEDSFRVDHDMLEQGEIEDKRDEKRGLYPDKIDDAN